MMRINRSRRRRRRKRNGEAEGRNGKVKTRRRRRQRKGRREENTLWVLKKSWASSSTSFALAPEI